MNLVFVYGSLKKGFSNSKILNYSRFVSKATTVDKFAMFQAPFGYFPAVIKENMNTIQGEVYKVSDKVLSKIDKLEGHPELYKRELVQIKLNNSSIELCYLYFYQLDDSFGESLSYWKSHL